MYKNFSVICFFAALFVFTGCSSVEVNETVLIISDPPGARIEINNEYLGDTPYKLKVEGLVPFDITILAYPSTLSTERYFLQKKTISIFYDNKTKSVFFPERVYFDMRQREITPRSETWNNIK
jgi:hypothetical protein